MGRGAKWFGRSGKEDGGGGDGGGGGGDGVPGEQQQQHQGEGAAKPQVAIAVTEVDSLPTPVDETGAAHRRRRRRNDRHDGSLAASPSANRAAGEGASATSPAIRHRRRVSVMHAFRDRKEEAVTKKHQKQQNKQRAHLFTQLFEQLDQASDGFLSPGQILEFHQSQHVCHETLTLAMVEAIVRRATRGRMHRDRVLRDDFDMILSSVQRRCIKLASLRWDLRLFDAERRGAIGTRHAALIYDFVTQEQQQDDADVPPVWIPFDTWHAQHRIQGSEMVRYEDVEAFYADPAVLMAPTSNRD